MVPVSGGHGGSESARFYESRTRALITAIVGLALIIGGVEITL